MQNAMALADGRAPSDRSRSVKLSQGSALSARSGFNPRMAQKSTGPDNNLSAQARLQSALRNVNLNQNLNTPKSPLGGVTFLDQQQRFSDTASAHSGVS